MPFAATLATALQFTTVPLYTYSGTLTFTPAGATGRNGPTLAQCRTAYSSFGTWVSNTAYFNMTNQGVQQWTVPATRGYTVVCAGGGSQLSSACGAVLTANFSFTKGQVLYLVVGHVSLSTSYGEGAGGTFVLTSNGTPFIVAGGASSIGGSGVASANLTPGGTGGSSATTSVNSNVTIGPSSGGSGGGGGGGGGNDVYFTGGYTDSHHGGGGGAGLTGNGGANGTGYQTGSTAIVQGGVVTGGVAGSATIPSTAFGGIVFYGSFGGGGPPGPVVHYNPSGTYAVFNPPFSAGGGGGYSGGGGGTSSVRQTLGYGGGGGSFCSVTPTSSNVTNAGNGYVSIT